MTARGFENCVMNSDLKFGIRKAAVGAGTQLKRPSLPCRVKLRVFALGCLGMPWRLPKQYHLSRDRGLRVSSGDDIKHHYLPAGHGLF